MVWDNGISVVRVAAAWNRLPAHDRIEGGFSHQPRNVVQAQLLGLIDPPSPVVMAEIPSQFQTFLKAARYAGLSTVLNRDWRTAQTPLGCTSMVFAGPATYQLIACLAISTCDVSYLSMGGNERLQGHRAVQVLLDYVTTVIADNDACRLAGWDPVGHEIMEIAEFLEGLTRLLGE